MFTASLRDPETLEWENRKNPGFIAASRDPIELDALVTALLGRDPSTVDYLRLASDEFGGWDEETVRRGLKGEIKIV